MKESERELGLQLGEAHAEIRSQAKEIEGLRADAETFAGRLKEERERCALEVDHILKDGGGTYGDAIRRMK